MEMSKCFSCVSIVFDIFSKNSSKEVEETPDPKPAAKETPREALGESSVCCFFTFICCFNRIRQSNLMNLTILVEAETLPYDNLDATQ